MNYTSLFLTILSVLFIGFVFASCGPVTNISETGHQGGGNHHFETVIERVNVPANGPCNDSGGCDGDETVTVIERITKIRVKD